MMGSELEDALAGVQSHHRIMLCSIPYFDLRIDLSKIEQNHELVGTIHRKDASEVEASGERRSRSLQVGEQADQADQARRQENSQTEKEGRREHHMNMQVVSTVRYTLQNAYYWLGEQACQWGDHSLSVAYYGILQAFR